MEEKIKPKQPKQSKSIVDLFFSLGDKVTKGDPVRAMSFQYYMLVILFIAFTTMFILNTYRFIITLDLSFLVWSLIGFAIASLQYFNLKNFHFMRKAQRNPGTQLPKAQEEEHKVEDIDEMLSGFKNGTKTTK